MRCSEVQELLSAFIDDEVSPQEAELIREHLCKCIKCQEHLHELLSLVSLLHNTEEVEPPAQFCEELHAKLLAEQNKVSPQVTGLKRYFSLLTRKSISGLAAAAVFVVAFMLGTIFEKNMFESPTFTDETQFGKGQIKQANNNFALSLLDKITGEGTQQKGNAQQDALSVAQKTTDNNTDSNINVDGIIDKGNSILPQKTEDSPQMLFDQPAPVEVEKDVNQEQRMAIASLNDMMQASLSLGGSGQGTTSIEDNNYQNHQKCLLKSVELELDAENVHSAFLKITKIAQKYGGYIENASTWDDETEKTQSFIVIRANKQHTTAIMKELESVGLVIQERNNEHDITWLVVELEKNIAQLQQQEQKKLAALASTARSENERMMQEIKAIQEQIKMLQRELNRQNRLTETVAIQVNIK